MSWFVLFGGIILLVNPILAQPYDLLLNDGHVIDAKSGIDGRRDVAIRNGRIARVAQQISPNEAERVVEAQGYYVTPGLIDIHTHIFFGTQTNAYLSNGPAAVAPDSHSFRSGITTMVDAGGAGWKNFDTFKTQVIERSKTRVLAFLNIVGSGMKGGAAEQNLDDMNAEQAAAVARAHPEIVGIKVAHYAGPEWTPVNRAVAAGTSADRPVMVDFGGNLPPLALDSLLLHHLRPGDIFTHTFAHVPGRTPVVTERGQVRDYVREAQRRGVHFDVGHGAGSFLFRQAVPALQAGFYPNTISTDLHTGSMNGGMQDLLNVMSKFLNMGMPLSEVIAAVTWGAAQIIHQDSLGHLSSGAVADVTVMKVREGTFGLVDVGGYRLDGTRKLECELTLRNGEVVWDLNGWSRPYWIKQATER